MVTHAGINGIIIVLITMKAEEFIPYLKKFITVRLDDNSEESGYIANPDDFKDPSAPPEKLNLLNGLMNSEVMISRIVSVSLPVREDTLKIPIIGFDTDLEPQVQEEDIDEQIDTLYQKSLAEDLDLDLSVLLKDSHG